MTCGSKKLAKKETLDEIGSIPRVVLMTRMLRLLDIKNGREGEKNIADIPKKR